MRTMFLSLVVFGVLASGQADAVVWSAKPVGQLSSTYQNSDCILFTLEGVSEADPGVPGNPWFAIPRSQYGSKDAYAMLLSAKLSGQTISIATNGSSAACGYAGVYQVWMQ